VISFHQGSDDYQMTGDQSTQINVTGGFILEARDTVSGEFLQTRIHDKTIRIRGRPVKNLMPFDDTSLETFLARHQRGTAATHFDSHQAILFAAHWIFELFENYYRDFNALSVSAREHFEH